MSNTPNVTWVNPQWGTYSGPDAQVTQRTFESLGQYMETKVPRGIVGYGSTTADVTAIPTVTPKLLVTMTRPATSFYFLQDRSYKFSAHWRNMLSTAVADILEFQILVGGTVIQRHLERAEETVSGHNGGHMSRIWTPALPSSMAVVLQAVLLVSSGLGAKVSGDVDYPIELVVEDVGPAV